ncbi:MAG: iron donor protein CyaY [Gammaproteobacteria bacterium]|nr:iron donor protein CyaY [Gammaproteobacteria bacterium]
MEEREFNQKVDTTLAAIEDALENSDADLDWDFAGGILSIECNNGSHIIINRQTPTRQIWVAARSGGFQFGFDPEANAWRQGKLELFALLDRVLSEQSGEPVQLLTTD